MIYIRIIKFFIISTILSISLACSNSEYTEYDDDENSTCYDNFRLPKTNSKLCRSIFNQTDTLTFFPKSGFLQKTLFIIFPDNKPLNCEIGGIPVTKKSPLISSLLINSSQTIRCADFSKTQSNFEIIRTYIFEKKTTIPAIFITTDPRSLFDSDTGIYMEGPNAKKEAPHYGANYWLDKEIPIFIELVEAESEVPAFSKYAGLKIFGQWSRKNAKKSVAITFRKKYGEKRLNYPLFPEHPDLKVFKSFILRNFGNSFGKDYIRDRLASSISEGLGVDYQRGRFVIVYYNGRYFGIHDMRERSNEYYFETHYGESHNNINLLKADNTISAGTADDYVALINWLKNNSARKEENYAYISSQIDIDNYINYMQVEIFANNIDWPNNNLKKWNTIIPKRKWKWLLYDLDHGFGYAPYTQKNIFNHTVTQDFLLRHLLKNKNFKTAFINQMLTLLKTNFKRELIISKIEEMMNNIKTEIPRD